MRLWILFLAFVVIAVGILAWPSICDRYCCYAPINSCINNLRFLDGAKQQWALDNHKSTNDVPTTADLTPYIHWSSVTSCPASGVYTLRRVADVPICSLKGHQLE